MRFITISLAMAVLCIPAITQTIVIPSGTAATEGSTSNAFPWGRGSAASLQMQCIYDSSHFTLQGVTTPVTISRLRWRLNGAVAATVAASYTNAMVDLATAALPAVGASTTFAANMLSDRVNVYTGPVAQLVVPASTPGGWFVDITLTTPFTYNPALGGLVIWTDLPPGVGTGVPALQQDVHAVASACRVFNSTAYGAPTGTITASHGVVCELTYAPALGLFPAFSASVTRGPSPLAVQFNDLSYTSGPGAVTSWSWDFNGDAVVDSTVQNPTFNYTTCGSYTVSLTVTDATHPAGTFTRTGYILTDRITANFTDQLIAPLTVQFTDTSDMAATSWAWDFNGDSVIDSTVQNPTFVYANNNPVNVSLTVTRLCSPPSTVTRSIVADQRLPTNFTANNGGASLWTVLFDVNVLNPRGVNIHAFDVISSSVSLPFTLDVYLKPGSYLGSEFVPAAWTQVGTASGTSNATANLPSNATLPTSLYIPSGSYGMALRYIGIVPRYLSLTALTTVGNGDLSLTLGAATVTTTAAFAGTTINTPRGWSGTIYYGTHNVTSEAGYGFFAPGCPGTLGVPGNTASALPRLGMTMTANLSRLNMNAAFMMVGFSRTTSIVGPLPLNLAPFGAPGCFGRVSPDSVLLIVGAGNTASYNLSVPNNAIYLGNMLFTQGLALDTPVNALGAVSSDAAGFIVGS